MIPKSGNRFSEKIMLQEKVRAGLRFNQRRSRSRSSPLCPGSCVEEMALSRGFEPRTLQVEAACSCPLSYESEWSCGRELNPRSRFCRPADVRSRHRNELAPVQGFEPRSPGSEPGILPLNETGMVRVRCSAHRPPRSKRGTLLHELHPVDWSARQDSNPHFQLRLRFTGS